ncbi:MAG TPA: IPT/TIG domain-containing protein [Terriglobales bacterium]|nr:IPT/TIG domain-containing protein [Terriglobales bacterium]
MSRVSLCFVVTLALVLAGCGYGSNYNGGGTGSPAVTSLTPNMATAGDPDFTLTVNGSAFGTDSVVYWNGTALPSSYSTTSKVTATVPATDIATAGMIPVYVRSGGKISNSVMFTVQ